MRTPSSAAMPRKVFRSARRLFASGERPGFFSTKILYTIYGALTAAEFIALILLGLSPYDAAIHSMATAGTGGFSNYGASIAAFNSIPVEMTIALFMFLFGINFALYYRFIIGDHFKAFFKGNPFGKIK